MGLDYLDLSYLLGGLWDYLFNAVPWLVISVIVGIALLVVGYIFPCTVIRNMARKAGLKRDWMAFVPIANDIYRLDIVSMPRWKVLFFGGTGSAVIGLILDLIFLAAVRSGGSGWIIVGALVFAAWLTMCVLTTYKYYSLLFKGFGYNPSLALVVFFTGLGPVITFGLQVAFAYNNRIHFSLHPGEEVDVTGKTPPITPLPSSVKGTITGLSGAFAGAVFTIKKGETITFGRDPLSCNVIYDQFKTAVSKKHCEISFDNTFYYVTDYSSNGTYLENGKRLAPQQTELLPKGSVIYLADKAETFRLS